MSIGCAIACRAFFGLHTGNGRQTWQVDARWSTTRRSPLRDANVRPCYPCRADTLDATGSRNAGGSRPGRSSHPRMRARCPRSGRAGMVVSSFRERRLSAAGINQIVTRFAAESSVTSHLPFHRGRACRRVARARLLRSRRSLLRFESAPGDFHSCTIAILLPSRSRTALQPRAVEHWLKQAVRRSVAKLCRLLRSSNLARPRRCAKGVTACPADRARSSLAATRRDDPAAPGCSCRRDPKPKRGGKSRRAPDPMGRTR